ncbi:DUF1573 domain-containing protein [Mongoliitalea lutea]|uniref:DUF1573 domain-containing protein n=1 Tax=Mongoliitalea lutea TaxID=849756 RepID=A0A8J3D0J6_9BACT|nr:DUF1573 domain-containing protein [Mongoliitalea lutea]GHB51991.1 hypothetical protein GCM10008106_35910 [Mongoliitalea lutea]
MKYLKVSALMLGVALMVFACDSKTESNGEQAAKIADLEQKLARLEASQPIATPTNVSNSTPSDPTTLGQFKFEETEYNFGTINDGEVVEKIFKFTNEGQAPLVISNITASCGCTSPDWSKAPVKPGEEGFVKVVFNSTAKPGAQSPTVTIQANTSPSITRLSLRGNVTPKIVYNTSPAAGPVKRD